MPKATKKGKKTVGTLTRVGSERDRHKARKVVRNLPTAPSTAGRMKRILESLKPWATEGFKGIVVDLVRETVRKMIWPS
jgi:hypothetical protein